MLKEQKYKKTWVRPNLQKHPQISLSWETDGSGNDAEALKPVCKTEQKHRPRAVDVLTWASSALRTFSALRTTLTFATKLHQPRWYLSTAQPQRQWLTADEVLETSIQPLIRIRQKPLPPNPASFRGYWVMYELFSINERHPLSWSGHILRLLESILRILTAFVFPLKTNPLFVFRGKLSRTVTCCDTDLNVAQARRKTVAV